MADGYKGTFKERGLYAESIEFPIFFRVEGACNNKPTLSSVDDGIGRRVRIINYPVKFIDEPDANNKYQALLNPEMAGILSSVAIRNTYIRMLIERFVKVASKITKENVPNQIKDDSKEYIQDCNEVLGFILEGYDVTHNEEDKIQSSYLFTQSNLK
jgi:phage/plasmid-associated DNA primase